MTVFEPFSTLELATSVWVGLAVTALLAGFVDAVVGGGGLIQIPVLFNTISQAPAAWLLGTNKCVGVFGTAMAARTYLLRISPPWRLVTPAVIVAGLAAVFGAYLTVHISTDLFRKALPLILLGLLLYTLRNAQLGLETSPALAQVTLKQQAVVIVASASLGFYDGVFGPGTGSFLVFMWVRAFGLDFLRASASAKVVNLACNLGALFWFVPSGQVLLGLAVWMMVFNVIGSALGSTYAMKYGAVFVRKMFIILVFFLILKTSYDAYLKS